MPAGFEALSDHDVRPRRGGRFSFPDRTDLAEDQASGITQPAHDEQHHRCDTLRDHGIKLGLEKVGIRGCWNEIHAEVSSRRRANSGDFGSDEDGSLTHHAKETKAAGSGYGGHQF